MGPAPPLMTAHEYFRTPETVKPMELAFGALRVADSPSAYFTITLEEIVLNEGQPFPFRRV